MNAIVAVDEKWGIGREGELLFSIPEDMRFFKSVTEGKVVVMGRRTFESLPGGKPLKNRVNIVLTSGMTPTGGKTTPLQARYEERVIVCNSLDQLFEAVGEYDPDDVFVIGGQNLYEQLLGQCSRVFVTKVGREKKADRWFPDLDSLDGWAAESKSEDREWSGLTYAFYVYINKN